MLNLVTATPKLYKVASRHVLVGIPTLMVHHLQGIPTLTVHHLQSIPTYKVTTITAYPAYTAYTTVLVDSKDHRHIVIGLM